jgi:transcriptional regulator with XRE-family HTH domain
MDIHPLRAFRENHEPPLSQADLAALLGVKTPTVWRWEANERKIDDGLVPAVSEKTGIPVAVLRPDLAELFKSQGVDG